ncbi:hypothetical protein HAX54_039908, partial [Datura stramonium]|nr:hypothetical protein [Datura stramonium]
VANMTARNNTKLTALIEHIPEMIKRAIDMTLSLVHTSIYNLEEGVSALESIGTREAIAALRAYMIKVKGDIQ